MGSDRTGTLAVGKGCPRDAGAGCFMSTGDLWPGKSCGGWALGLSRRREGSAVRQTLRQRRGYAALPAMLLAKYSGYHSIILVVRGPSP